MKKMSTLYIMDPNNSWMFKDEINPVNRWALESIPTRKFDGMACSIINGVLYRRYNAKFDITTKKHIKKLPKNALPCQRPDMVTGSHPHWVKCEKSNPSDEVLLQAFNDLVNKQDGSYELCGEKVNGNPEKINGHKLIKHGLEVLDIDDFSYDSLKDYLSKNDIEGIVFHSGNKMCKIRQKDFGLDRKTNN